MDPVLLLQGSLLAIALAVTTSILGVATLTLATIGYLMAPIPSLARIILGAAALAMIVPGWVSDIGGLAIASIILTLLISGRVGKGSAAY